MILSEIHIFPIKSCGGIQLERTQLDRFGACGDRRWMLVDKSGRFLSQRDLPRMCLVGVSQRLDGGLDLSLGARRIAVAQPPSAADSVLVRVWEDTVRAQRAAEESSEALSEFLQTECWLVFLPDSSERLVDGLYARDGETVSFADGFPLLLISKASLDELNNRLPAPVPMNRFRPNLVVDGCEPFAEDSWQQIRIGDQRLRVAKPCSRCVIPSIDQDNAQRDPHILRALAGFRRREGAVYFGQNLLYETPGELSAGDAVEVLA